MLSQQQFELTISKFHQLEPARASLYDMGLNLLKAEVEIEAYLLILATWNFANFRYILTRFDLKAFRNVIESTKPTFERLKNQEFRTCNLDEIASEVKSIYADFKALVGQTGASKIVRFKHPPLFVMWDTAIRKEYKIPNTVSPEDYIKFMKLMQKEFRHIQWNTGYKTLAKVIDEYNFIIVHQDRKVTGRGDR